MVGPVTTDAGNVFQMEPLVFRPMVKDFEKASSKINPNSG